MSCQILGCYLSHTHTHETATAMKPARPCPGIPACHHDAVGPHCPGCLSAPSLTEEEKTFIWECLDARYRTQRIARLAAIIDRLTGGA
jgi:hypothetical protein